MMGRCATGLIHGVMGFVLGLLICSALVGSLLPLIHQPDRSDKLGLGVHLAAGGGFLFLTIGGGYCGVLHGCRSSDRKPSEPPTPP